MFQDPEEIIDISDAFQLDSLPNTPRSSKSIHEGGGGSAEQEFNFRDETEDDIKSVNFGGGLDLLMNDKFKDKKSGGGGSLSGRNEEGKFDQLDELELELNNLTSDTNPDFQKPNSGSSSSSSSSSFFSFPTFSSNGGGNGNGSTGSGGGSSGSSASTLGRETASQTFEEKKTWDGFGKLTGAPTNPDKPFVPPEKEMTKEEMMREKFRLLKKIQTLEKKHGVEFSKKYNMDSSFSEMKGEYESVIDEREKHNSIKWQGNMLMMFVNGVEYLNDKFDPFDINLEGWSDQVSDNLPDYDELFAELHEKYKSKGKWAPELRLLFQLGGSAMMVHMSNKMFKSSLPSVDDIFKQNPDLMKQFQSAAVNSMGQSNPGFAGFMNSVMGGGPTGGPPPPIPEEFITQSRGGNNISSSPPLFRQSVPPPPPPTMHLPTKRAEMKGPSDISDILSGLKTKSIQIQPPSSSSSSSSSSPLQAPTNAKRSLSQFFGMNEDNHNNNNKVRAQDLDAMSVNSMGDSSLNPAGAPKRSKRKPKSNSNTLSLDI